MHTSVLLSLLLAGGVAPHQDARVSIQVRAAAAPVVVDQIAKQTGLKLTSDRNMWRDYVCVSVKNVTPDQLMAKIATACQAKWVASGDAKSLVPDYDLRNRMEAAKASASAQGYAKSISNLIESLDPKPKKPTTTPKPPTTPEEAEEAFMPGPAGPGKRLLVAYIRALGPAFFARLAPDTRIVMSSGPTRMQTSLPNIDAVPFITKWVAEHNDMVKSGNLEIETESEVTSPEQDEMMKLMTELGLERNMRNERPTKIDAMPSKLLLVVANMKNWGGPRYASIALRAYNNQGKLILSEDHSLSNDPRNQGDEEMVRGIAAATVAAAPGDDDDDEVPQPAKPSGPATKLPLSEGSKSWLRAHSQRMFRRQVKEESKAKPEDLDYVANMVDNEPLATVATDFMFDMATRNSVNVVASLPDSVVNQWAYGIDEDKIFIENITRNLFGNEKSVVPRSQLQLTKDAGWWVASPRDAEEARRNRIDRVAASKALMSFRKSDWLTLDAVATYTASVPEEAASTLNQWTSCILDLSPFGGIFGGGAGGDQDWLRLWGTLDPGSRLSLRQGTPVIFSMLSEGARKEIAKHVFGAEAKTMKFPPAKANNELQIMNSMMMGMAMGSMQEASDLAEEPTEYLPNGLDMRGRLLSQSFTEPYLSISGAEVSFLGTGSLGAEEFALVDIMSTMPGIPQEDAGMSLESAKLRTGKRTSLRLRAEVAPERGLQGMLMDPQKPSDTEFTTKNLPADVQAEIDRKKALIKASPLMKLLSLSFSQMGRMGGQAPPP